MERSWRDGRIIVKEEKIKRETGRKTESTCQVLIIHVGDLKKPFTKHLRVIGLIFGNCTVKGT